MLCHDAAHYKPLFFMPGSSGTMIFCIRGQLFFLLHLSMMLQHGLDFVPQQQMVCPLNLASILQNTWFFFSCGQKFSLQETHSRDKKITKIICNGKLNGVKWNNIQEAQERNKNYTGSVEKIFMKYLW